MAYQRSSSATRRFLVVAGALGLGCISMAAGCPGAEMALIAPVEAAPAALRPTRGYAPQQNETGVAPTAAAVESGLLIRPEGGKLVITPGRCWVNDRLVEIADEVVLDVPPALPERVEDEPVTLAADSLNGQFSKTILKGCRASASDPVTIAGVLEPGSLSLKAAAGKAAPRFKPNTDYLVDEKWGAVAVAQAGALKKGQTVYADYRWLPRRLDTLALDEQGKFRLIRGRAVRSAPEPPSVHPSLLPLANIYIAPGKRSLSKADILPILTRSQPGIAADVRERNRKALAKTLAKLEGGQPVTIVFWGDSITAGADASQPDRWFVNVLLSRLRAKYPKSSIYAVNLGVGGSNTKDRLPAYQSEVLSRKPDLIVVEFVNDLVLEGSVLESNYPSIIAQALGAGSDVILCTPHLPSPALMSVKDWAAVAQKPYIKLLRKTAKAVPVALADVAARWENLGREGLRPDLMLVDEVVHPNDRGHEIYAEELIKCFD